MFSFERQDSEQTLAEGMAEYHAKSKGLEDCRDSTSDSVEFFRCDDAAHVVFGCGNSQVIGYGLDEASLAALESWWLGPA